MRYVLAVALLGAASGAWAAVPIGGTGEPGVLLLLLAAACIFAGLLRLIRKDVPQRDPYTYLGTLAQLGHRANDVLMGVSWETGAAIALVGLEALHPSRPWHTGIFAVLVTCYLLAVHQAGSAVPAAALRGQGRIMVTSLALVIVATGVAMVPSAGAESGWLEILAALAAVTAGGLALPL